FFYNNLSGSVSYHDDCTNDANQFAAEYQRSYVNHDKARAGQAQITIVATDGELYGHHKAWRDKFLSHFLKRSASAYGLEVCSLERYLRQYPAIHEVAICEPSSWSCMHGVRRWSVGCECTEGDDGWKYALRCAISELVLGGDARFKHYGGQILSDPWA